eukprot:scaffold1000_cov166-Amphora_coffeaeformis.AAC.2
MSSSTFQGPLARFLGHAFGFGLKSPRQGRRVGSAAARQHERAHEQGVRHGIEEGVIFRVIGRGTTVVEQNGRDKNKQNAEQTGNPQDLAVIVHDAVHGVDGLDGALRFENAKNAGETQKRQVW